MMSSIIHALGIDIGSTTTKMVGVNENGEMIWHRLEPADPRVEDQVERFFHTAQQETNTPENIPSVATGYGRRLALQATRQVTEISCHARGIYHDCRQGCTLVDIGGQDSKVIRISPLGKVLDFVMNDKCAAGTGRFLENTANRLQVALVDLGSTALSTTQETSISSICTVFAESEVISLIAHGEPLPAILRGLHHSLVKRITSMVHSVGLVPPLILSGGVALNPAIQQLLALETGLEVVVPHNPQLIGALGAALLALEIKGVS